MRSELKSRPPFSVADCKSQAAQRLLMLGPLVSWQEISAPY
jgi:hypothetical protein